jgi:hypothetical protein
MAGTAQLIESLTARIEPVTPIASPGRRTVVWLLAAAVVIAGTTWVMGVRDDLAQEFSDCAFVLGCAAAVLTGLTAATAAFRVSVPGRSVAWLWLPMPFLVVWVGTMGYGCISDWIVEGENGLRLGRSYECLAAILVTSLPLGLLLLLMVRHAARVRRVPTAIAGGIALAAIAEAGLKLYHDAEATVMDLLIHLLGMSIVIAISIAASRGLFRRVDPLQSSPAAPKT